MISLWPHQRDGLLCTLAAFESSRSAALVHATGTGKSITIAALNTIMLNRGAERVLTCTPRGELVRQLYVACQKVSGLPDHRIGVEMASERASTAVKIVIASLDSLSKERLKALGQVDLVVIDEAHWAPKKFIEVLDAFPNAKVLGATATPDRLDGMPLSPYFEVLAHVYDVKDAIADGRLVPLEFIEEEIGYEYADDLVLGFESDRFKRVVLAAAEQAILKHLMEPGREIPFIAYCNSVANAYELADDLGPMVRCVEGDMPEREREKAIWDFKERRLIGLTCRDLLTFGFDYPALGAVVIARSTQEGSPASRSLVSQICGRVTRKYPGKEKGIVLDLVGALRRHKLRVPEAILRWSLTEMQWPLVKTLNTMLDAVSVSTVGELEQAEHAGVTLSDDSLRVFLTGSEILDPLIPLLGIEVPGREDGDPNATEDQRKRLEEAGFDLDALLSQMQADVLLEAVEAREAQGLATIRQARVVARYGLDPNMLREDADFCLTALEAAYWPKKRLPAAIAARPELFYTGGGVVTIRS